MKLHKTPSRTIKVTTLDAFTASVAEVRDMWDFESGGPIGPWYRGQQRQHWSLLPSIMRDGVFNRSSSRRKFDLETESEIREEFVVRAPALSGSETVPENQWNSYFLMQHYGAPTRLIDWTESSLIALYFAVRDNPGYYNSAVWMLDPYEMNERVINRGEVIAPSAPGTRPRDIKVVDAWLPMRFNTRAILPRQPIAVYPTHFVRRISSQKSCFTVHGSSEQGFDQFRKRNPCLVQIVIPAFSVVKIRQALEAYGIDETTIFPDLEGLGRALVTKWRRLEEESAHKNAYVRLKPSRLHKAGIGVFAIRPVPKGQRVFAGENEEILWTKKESLPSGRALRRLYNDFCIIKDDLYGSPTSFNRLTPAWFLNDSKKPNTRCNENYDFVASRNIRTGEELTVDYSTFSGYPSA
jgi:FRG domain-containing protein/SET domain-containing protein